tara:strand:- start:632805 stop:633596 length:792 start_codon:yes stop_codon:yes gene_type:complete
LNKNLATAIQAAVDAGKEIMKIYNSEFDFELKDDASPLTLADKNANAIINDYLIKTKMPIISEENAQIDYAIRKEWKQCWIVDPLDGTKEFIKRNGEFTVNIALVDQGQPILGIIYVPVTKKLYVGDVENESAYVLVLNADTIINKQTLVQAKELKPQKNTSNQIRVVGSRSHMNTETLDFVAMLKEKYQDVEVVSKGSSLKFCLVAEGLADIYPRFAPTMEWDTAAAQAICKAAGIKVLATQTNKELTYNKENLLNPWFICK